MSSHQKIVLLAVVFDSKSALIGGNFKEIIKPWAIERTLQEKIDVRAMVNHDHNMLIGRLSARTLRMLRDPDGLRVEIIPPETSYARDVVVSIDRTDIDGASFWFQALKDQWYVEEGEDVREVHDMRIFEVSPVVFPAYEDSDASLEPRSLGRTLEDMRRQHYHVVHALDWPLPESREVGSMESRDGERELAMLKWPNGETVQRKVAMDSVEEFRAARRARFGNVISTGNWRWSRDRGWFEVPPPPSAGLRERQAPAAKGYG